MRKATKKKSTPAKSTKTPSVDDVFRADDRWIRLMANRNYFREFMEAILPASEIEEPVCYQGNFFFADDEDITPLIDAETHDLVVNKPSKFTSVKGQNIYASPLEYLLQHRPVNGCLNVYFVGDVHGEANKGDFNVHWNCFMVTAGNDKTWILWYDPAYTASHVMRRTYNFDQTKKKDIVDSLYRITGKVPVITISPPEQAQQICNPEFDCVDSFCQTWVLMFAAMYIEGNVKEFLNLSFKKYGNLILKTWLYCIIKARPSLKEWVTEMKGAVLKNFSYCRLQPPQGAVDDSDVVITKVDTLTLAPGQSCSDAVLQRFS